MPRPERLLVVAGTGTEIGKTWVTHALLAELQARGRRVAARKPVQSFDPADGRPTDAEVLAAATGERPDDVCPPHRSYPLAVAPPMAAEMLARPRLRLADLVVETAWPAGVALGLVETVGGVRSPLAHDADSAGLAAALRPDGVLLVADAGLGAINAVRLSVGALAPLPVTVFLNRYDHRDELHRRNRDWLVDVDSLTVDTALGAVADRWTPPK